MLSIQEVGSRILSDHPDNFYVFLGSEYGIKNTYLKHLKTYYGSYKEVDKMSDILKLFSTKRLIPLEPKLYIVRYDDEFLNTLDNKMSLKIASLDISGTIVCIYESDKASSKIKKYLPDYAVSIDEVAPSYLLKYLKSEFDIIPDSVLRDVVLLGTNYQDCINMCMSLSGLSSSTIHNLSKQTIADMLGKSSSYNESKFKIMVMNRNYIGMMNSIDLDDMNYDSCIYAIMSSMIELEKVLTGSKVSDSYRKYSEIWDLRSVYNLFMNCYDQVVRLRYSGMDPKYSLLYLASLLRFRDIPSMEDM